MRKIIFAASPVGDFIEWSSILIVMLRVLVVNYILDLPIPM